MKFESINKIPASYVCRKCGREKPIQKMMLVHMRREGIYRLRPRCKDCHNAGERGHRREWKTKYLQRWRRENPGLNESYWRKRAADKARVNAYALRHFYDNHYAILIQGRLRRRLGMRVSLHEAKKRLSEYGPCYPTIQGLTPKGIKKCEQIRSRLRRHGVRANLVEIRMMVYADGYYIKPGKQKIPYQHSAENLRSWRISLEKKAA